MTEPFCFVSKIYIFPCFINIITNNEAQMQRGLHVLGTANLDMISHSVDMPSAFFSVQWVNEKIIKIHLFTVLPVQTTVEKKIMSNLLYFTKIYMNLLFWIQSCTDMSPLPLDRGWIMFERPIFCFALS